MSLKVWNVIYIIVELSNQTRINIELVSLFSNFHDDKLLFIYYVSFRKNGDGYLKIFCICL